MKWYEVLFIIIVAPFVNVINFIRNIFGGRKL